jgi:hypothetical protein
MGMASGEDRLDRNVEVAIRSVLESNRTAQTRGQFAVDLALSCPCSDCSPTHEVR